MRRLAALFRLALFLALAGVCGLLSPTLAREQTQSAKIAAVAIASLPVEAKQTLQLIQQGGLFPTRTRTAAFSGISSDACRPKPEATIANTPSRHQDVPTVGLDAS